MSIFATTIAFAEEQKEGKLDAFEKEVVTKEGDEKGSVYEQVDSGQTSTQTAAFDSKSIAAQGIFDILLTFFLMGLSQTGTENFPQLYRDLKSEWSPALPTIRVEPSYQYLIGGMHGLSGKAEAGFLILGVDGEYIRYFEKSPKQSLDIWDAHFLLRTIFTRHFGINLALGVKAVRGGQTRTGFDFGIPFYINITNNFIFDIQPFLATVSGKNIYDLGAGLAFKYKLIGIRAGYRAMFVGDERLHGPRVGIFLQY